MNGWPRHACIAAGVTLAIGAVAPPAAAAPPGTPPQAESPGTPPQAESPEARLPTPSSPVKQDAASTAAAQRGVEVNLAVDLPLSLAAGLLAGGFVLLRDELGGSRCAPDCDESQINALDRPFAGRYDPNAALASDVLVAVNLALPHLFGLLDLALGTHPEGAVGFGEDTLILAEVAALSGMTQQIVALAAQRPRPFVYGDQVELERRRGGDAYLAFYSGHTASSFAMASAYSTLYGIRHPRGRWTGAVWALTHGLAAMDGALRVLAGSHYPTDVLVGGAMGSAIGLLVPWLHVTAAASSNGSGATDAVVSSSDAPVAGVTIMPLASSTYAGVSLTLW